MVNCPVCYNSFDKGDYKGLSEHMISEASESNYEHVSWLNRNISKDKLGGEELEKKISRFYSLESKGIKRWIIDNFVLNFRGENPHPFILGMQKYDENLLKGYAVEHHHFLKQWIKSCAYVIAKSDFDDIHDYEMENIMTEMQGFGNRKPSHHELLIRMGISLGLRREEILNSTPLEATMRAIRTWEKIAEKKTWIEIMAAMHSLELVANRDLNRYGAKYPYFNPEILKDMGVKQEVKNFLREGYEADVSHSYVALDIIEKYAEKENLEDIQSAYLNSARVFGEYMEARIERGEMYKNKQ